MAIDKSQLILGSNFERFPPSHYKCPQCNGDTLRDESSPNYCSGTSSNAAWSDSGSIKHVCLNCQIHFLVIWWDIFAAGVADIGHKYDCIIPLVERDGKYLVPNDVRNYEYYDKHGMWPVRSYG